MTKCSCYHIKTERHYFTEFARGYNYARGIEGDYEDRQYGVCYGTPETDRCDCGGDESKCDFYPKVREKAKAKRQALLDKMELDFYHYYITLKGLEFDCAREYQKWKREQKDEHN